VTPKILSSGTETYEIMGLWVILDINIGYLVTLIHASPVMSPFTKHEARGVGPLVKMTVDYQMNALPNAPRKHGGVGPSQHGGVGARGLITRTV